MSCLFSSNKRSSEDLFKHMGFLRLPFIVLEKVHEKEDVKFSSKSGKFEQDIINAPET